MGPIHLDSPAVERRQSSNKPRDSRERLTVYPTPPPSDFDLPIANLKTASSLNVTDTGSIVQGNSSTNVPKIHVIPPSSPESPTPASHVISSPQESVLSTISKPEIPESAYCGPSGKCRGVPEPVGWDFEDIRTLEDFGDEWVFVPWGKVIFIAPDWSDADIELAMNGIRPTFVDTKDLNTEVATACLKEKSWARKHELDFKNRVVKPALPLQHTQQEFLSKAARSGSPHKDAPFKLPILTHHLLRHDILTQSHGLLISPNTHQVLGLYQTNAFPFESRSNRQMLQATEIRLISLSNQRATLLSQIEKSKAWKKSRAKGIKRIQPKKLGEMKQQIAEWEEEINEELVPELWRLKCEIGDRRRAKKVAWHRDVMIFSVASQALQNSGAKVEDFGWRYEEVMEEYKRKVGKYYVEKSDCPAWLRSGKKVKSKNQPVEVVDDSEGEESEEMSEVNMPNTETETIFEDRHEGGPAGAMNEAEMSGDETESMSEEEHTGVKFREKPRGKAMFSSGKYVPSPNLTTYNARAGWYPRSSPRYLFKYLFPPWSSSNLPSLSSPSPNVPSIVVTGEGEETDEKETPVHEGVDLGSTPRGRNAQRARAQRKKMVSWEGGEMSESPGMLTSPPMGMGVVNARAMNSSPPMAMGSESPAVMNSSPLLSRSKRAGN